MGTGFGAVGEHPELVLGVLAENKPADKIVGSCISVDVGPGFEGEGALFVDELAELDAFAFGQYGGYELRGGIRDGNPSPSEFCPGGDVG